MRRQTHKKDEKITIEDLADSVGLSKVLPTKKTSIKNQ